MGASTMILETQRLILREYVDEDLDHVHVYASDADIVQFMDFGPNSIADTKNFIKAMFSAQLETPRQSYKFAVTLKADGILIGGCGLGLERNRQASLGYILNRPYWGLGYATEAAMSLCEFGLVILNSIVSLPHVVLRTPHQQG